MFLRVLWLIVLMALEGALSYWFFTPENLGKPGFLPHLLLCQFVYWAYMEPGDRILWTALITGWVQDLNSGTPLLGIHALIYASVAVVIGFFARWQPNPDPFRWIFAFLIAVTMYDGLLYGINRMFFQTALPFSWFVTQHLFPDLLFYGMVIVIFLQVKPLLSRSTAGRN